MCTLGAVEPDWLGVVDCHLEDFGLGMSTMSLNHENMLTFVPEDVGMKPE